MFVDVNHFKIAMFNGVSLSRWESKPKTELLSEGLRITLKDQTDGDEWKNAYKLHLYEPA